MKVKALVLFYLFQFYPRSTIFVLSLVVYPEYPFNSIQDQPGYMTGVTTVDAIHAFNSIQDQQSLKTSLGRRFNSLFQFYPRSTGNIRLYVDTKRNMLLSILSKINGLFPLKGIVENEELSILSKINALSSDLKTRTCSTALSILSKINHVNVIFI